MAAQLGHRLLVKCHSVHARLHKTCRWNRSMMLGMFLGISIKRWERRKIKSPAYGYYRQQIIHGLHDILIITFIAFLMSLEIPVSMLGLGKDLLQFIVQILSIGEILNELPLTLDKLHKAVEQMKVEQEQGQNYDFAGSITSLDTDELVDQQNYDVARSISPTEATSLNTDELVDQQNYDVAPSITCISNFSHCETEDPIRATELGTVSSLNTELFHQHAYDAASSVSCTLDFSQWDIRDSRIGEGGFADVYVASHRETGELCAVKKLKNPDNRDNTSSLIKEIELLKRLQHPYIVKYYGDARVGNQILLFMEYVETGTLTKYIGEEGACKESTVRDITVQILCVLEYLYSERVVHRDIKPDNILLDSHGFVKLIDFGMAKHVQESEGRHSKWGTSHYAAPETIEKKKYSSLDEAHAADIWSLGCVIIEMFTGRRPWSRREWIQVNFEVCCKKRDPEIPQDLSTEGKEFLQLCFERNPAKRPLASKLQRHRFVS